MTTSTWLKENDSLLTEESGMQRYLRQAKGINLKELGTNIKLNVENSIASALNKLSSDNARDSRRGTEVDDHSVARKWIVLCLVAVVIVVVVAIVLPVMLVRMKPNPLPLHDGRHVLDTVPLIDGHNDLPNNLKILIQNKLAKFNFRANLTNDPVWNCSSCFTDLPRLRAGHVGAQFWAAYTDCKTQYKDAVEQTLEQIDVIKRFVNAYPKDLQLVTSAQGILDAFNASKIGSLIGVEGGHSIDSRLGVLRLMYELGVRYLTLTHTCNTPWADASPAESAPEHNGLTEFGKIVVKEMNRLGMMVDISHVSNATMIDAINTSTAPVIFSHSSARKLCDHHRNVPDSVLKMMTKNNGIVMVNFYSDFIVCDNSTLKNATIEDVAAHINHIRSVAGVDHVGIGGDYDGVDKMPLGLQDVSKYPDLFDLLSDESKSGPKWTKEDLQKLAGLNFIRVFKDVEKVRDDLKAKGVGPYEDLIPTSDLKNNNTGCMTE